MLSSEIMPSEMKMYLPSTVSPNLVNSYIEDSVNGNLISRPVGSSSNSSNVNISNTGVIRTDSIINTTKTDNSMMGQNGDVDGKENLNDVKVPDVKSGMMKSNSGVNGVIKKVRKVVKSDKTYKKMSAGNGSGNTVNNSSSKFKARSITSNFSNSTLNSDDDLSVFDMQMKQMQSNQNEMAAWSWDNQTYGQNQHLPDSFTMAEDFHEPFGFDFFSSPVNAHSHVQQKDFPVPFSSNFTFDNFDPFEVDFTTFLERLEKTDRGDLTALSQQMMTLIAKYFHDCISIIKPVPSISSESPMSPNSNIGTNIFDESSKSSFTSSNRSSKTHSMTKVICIVDPLLNPTISVAVNEFLAESDRVLNNREDLKVALKTLFPPTVFNLDLESSYQSFENLRDDTLTNTNAYGLNTFSPSSKFGLGYGSTLLGRRKRKINENVSNFLQEEGNKKSNKILSMDNNGLKHLANPEEIKEGQVKAIKPKFKGKGRGRPRKNKALEISEGNERAVENVDASSRTSEATKSDDVDAEPDAEKDSVKINDVSNLSTSKVKTNSERAKEEADLVALGLESIEEKIQSLQSGLRTVKHKHRKGTMCPRCVAEQKLKVCLKARVKAANVPDTNNGSASQK